MNTYIQTILNWLPKKKIKLPGEQSLISKSLPYYLISIVSASSLFMDQINPFIFLSITYSIFSILDQIFTLDEQNPLPREEKQLQKNDMYFRAALYLAMISSWATNIKVLLIFSKAELTLNGIINVLGLTYIASNLFSVQFVISHQIMHKPSYFYRLLATLHMTNLYYTHFTYHHLEVHHRLVATPQDPTTARKGQNVYQFFYRCVVDSWIGVYKIQAQKGKKFFNNYAILSIIASLSFSLIVCGIFGVKAMIFQILMGIGAIFYLESISYIGHYGLLRKKLPNGQYEKVSILHSWNAPHRFTNYLLFKLQRHSDHHQNSSKPYQILASLPESPFLPHGYNLMILMQFFPQTWFRVIDPLLDEYRKLQLKDKGIIDEKIMEKATQQTRIFLVKVVFSAMGMFILSII